MAIGQQWPKSDFASILNSSVMLGNYLQQTTSADNIFRCIIFLGALRVKSFHFNSVCWIISNASVVFYWLFFKINFFKKSFLEHNQSVKWFGSRSKQIFCRSWSKSKLFAKVISGWQKWPLARKGLSYQLLKSNCFRVINSSIFYQWMQLSEWFIPQIFFLSLKCLLFTSVAYIQVHFRLEFFMEANNMNPDQTALSDLAPYCLQYRQDKRSRQQKSWLTSSGLI